MADSEIIKTFYVKKVEEEKEDFTNHPLKTDMAEIVTTQSETLKQIGVILKKFTSQERKITILSAELKTVSDEVIFLRKKLEENRNKRLDDKYKNLLSRIERIEKERSDYKLNFALQFRQIQKIKEDIRQIKKTWWRRWFSPDFIFRQFKIY